MSVDSWTDDLASVVRYALPLIGTFRKWRDVWRESDLRVKPDISGALGLQPQRFAFPRDIALSLNSFLGVEPGTKGWFLRDVLGRDEA